MQSVYSTVMRNALRKGVLVVKAAGNSGSDGPFTADVFTAVGSIASASVGDDFLGMPLDSQLVASGFSSYGPVREADIAACWLCRISTCTGAGAGSAVAALVADAHQLAYYAAARWLLRAVTEMSCRTCIQISP
jgi:hypothetical protein